jgi:hypothetical protein
MWFNGMMANNFNPNPTEWNWNNFNTCFTVLNGFINGWNGGANLVNDFKNGLSSSKDLESKFWRTGVGRGMMKMFGWKSGLTTGWYQRFYRNINHSMPYRIGFVREFIDLQFGDIPGILNFDLKLGLPPNSKSERWSYNKDGSYLRERWDKNGDYTSDVIYGHVLPQIFSDGNIKSTMYLSPWAFKSDFDLFMVTGHELVHVGQVSAGLDINTVLLENGAYGFNNAAAQMYGNEYWKDLAERGLNKYHVPSLLNERLQPYLYHNFIPKISFKPIKATIFNIVIY